MLRSGMLSSLRNAARMSCASQAFKAPTSVRAASTMAFSPLEKKENKVESALTRSYSTAEYALRDNKGDVSRRAFTYFVLGGSKFVYASIGRVMAVKLIATMSASADVLALASVEVDITSVEAGNGLTIKWRGKPVFIRHRSEEEITAAQNTSLSDLPDPQSDADRVQKPEWLILLGVCTHLGCVPLAQQGEYKGFFCPCHGSHYDTSGRIRKGPAPLNLEIPPYSFIEDDTKLLIG